MTAPALGPLTVTRPVVHVEPGMNFGNPQLRGISTDAIAGRYLVEGEAAVRDDYELSRHELLVVLWFEGVHGEYRAELGEWAQAVGWALARGDVDGVAAPEV